RPTGQGRRHLGAGAGRHRAGRRRRPAGGIAAVSVHAAGSGAAAAEAAAALEVQGLSLKIGGAQILQDISFSVPTGQMVGVIGPNGAGKTTLFNLVSGVLTPTSGRVLLEGRDVTGRSVTQRAVAGLGR